MPTDLPEDNRLTHYEQKMLFLSVAYVFVTIVAIIAVCLATHSGWWMFAVLCGALSQLALAGIIMAHTRDNADDLDDMLSQIREDIQKIKNPPAN